MVEHIIQLARDIIADLSNTNSMRSTTRLHALLRAMAEPFCGLDQNGFLPSARKDFFMLRNEVRRFQGNFLINGPPDYRDIKKMAESVISTLELYGDGEDHLISRSFAFIKDAGLRQIIERDYRDLHLKVFPCGAWKSAVVLAGSILEAILVDQLTGDPAVMIKAMASPKAPKDKGKTVRDLPGGKWNLIDLIAVSVDIGILPANRAKSIDQVLREYRNFVHPIKELRDKYPCTKAEAHMSIGALDAVCDILK